MQPDGFQQLPATLGLQPDPSVLLVEDDADVALIIKRHVERAGMRLDWARTGADAMRLKAARQPDIVLVDLGLPDMDGVRLISWLAAQRDCGVIVVSGRGEEIERVVGIELGADDYVTKPVPMRELVARIRAVHRRAARPSLPVPAAESGVVLLGGVRVDTRRRSVTRLAEDGSAAEPVHLTAAEFAALQALIEAAPEPVPRETLCRLALRRPFQAEDRGVDQLILNIRRKLFADTAAQTIIVAVRGAGYAIATDRDLMTIRPIGEPGRSAG